MAFSADQITIKGNQLYILEANGVTVREVRYTIAVTPTTTNDTTEGFQVGSRWVLDDGTTYVCTDSTEDDAVWELVTGLISVTKAALDGLVTSDALIPSALYEISGVDPTLYDDGTTSGTTIYLTALTKGKLAKVGTGIFYNPVYDQALPTFGVWTNLMTGVFSSIIGDFDYQGKEAVTADNSATGIVYSEGLILWVSGDWSAAVSITGDSSGATADISGFISPSYAIGDKVFWGGYAWENVNGNVGINTGILTLDAEWVKIAYNTVDYKIAFDPIEYEYVSDTISKRTEIEGGNVVEYTKGDKDLAFNSYGFPYSGISVFMWGNVFDSNTYGVGLKDNKIINSYFECINLLGGNITNNSLEGTSYFYDNTLIGCFITDNSFSKGTIVASNTVSFLSYFQGNIVFTSVIAGNIIGIDGYISYNILNPGSIIGYNLVLENSLITSNTVNGGSSISGNTLDNGSSISANTLDGDSSISGNTLFFLNAYTPAPSQIGFNALYSGSIITQNSLDGVNLFRNTLHNSIFNLSGSGTILGGFVVEITTPLGQTTVWASGYITNFDIRDSRPDVPWNIPPANSGPPAFWLVFTTKKIITNTYGISRLTYYNGSDVLQIVNVDTSTTSYY
jgi:hypothetical protein